MEKLSVLVNHYLREFKSIGKKQKIIIIVVLLASFLLGFVLPGFSNKLSTFQTPKPTPFPTPIPLPAVISLSSDLSDVKLGATFSATINISSPNQGVEAADFVVNFDPDFLKVATISSGNYFGIYPVKTAVKDKVKISGIANLVNDRFIIPMGKGQIGTIVFETLSATDSAIISFDREKTIVASAGKNILDKITDLEVSIK